MITCEGVTKTFPGRNGQVVEALRNVELEIQRGEFVVVTGPSGSGKSTLLFTLGGLQQPTEGRVIMGDTDVYGLSPTERAVFRRTQVGFVFQTFNLLPYLSALENVIVPAVLAGKSWPASYRRARRMLKKLGLEARLGHRPAELSVGERQRVAVCRSLMNDPELILADEPTGNLDPAMTGEVITILRSLHAEGFTIVMATHDRGLAQGDATRLIVLQAGLVVDDRRSRGKDTAG